MKVFDYITNLIKKINPLQESTNEITNTHIQRELMESKFSNAF